MANQALPNPGRYVDNSLVDLYGTTIDQLLADLGRNVTFYLPPTASGCPNCKIGFDSSSQGTAPGSNPFTGDPYNRPFPAGGVCPVCHGTHQILTVNTETYKMLIQREPKDIDYEQYGKDVNKKNVYSLKCKVIVFEDIVRAEKAKIDGAMCVKIRDPVKTGLRDIRYCKSWWIKTDG